MRLLHPAAIAASLTLIATAANAQLTLISLEQHNRQTSDSTTSVAGFTFYATAEEFETATSATVTASAGALNGVNQAMPNQGDFLEYEANPATANELLTNYPLSATYTISVKNALDSVIDTAVITGPGGTFSNLRPNAPVFSLGSITGTWTIENGQGVFTFDPTRVTSFTITSNGYGANVLGGNYGAYMSVAEIDGGYSEIGEVGIGPVAAATEYEAPLFTFTNGLAVDGNDDDDTTYGFTNGTVLELEAGFFNIFNYGVSDGGNSSEAFVVGSTTSFLLRAQASAIPEPSTYAQIFGAVAAVGAVIYRRRRKQR